MRSDPTVTQFTITPVPAPLFKQVYTAIFEAIKRGDLKDGDKLPTERELSERFQVSRATIRRAIGELVAEGRISPEVGRGSFVHARQLEDSLTSLISFSDLARERGLTPSARVIRAGFRPASPEESAVLNLPAHGMVFDLLRVRYLDGNPVALDHSRIPESAAKGFDAVNFEVQSIYELLVQGGYAPFVADVIVSAATTSRESEEYLETEPSAPLIVCKSISFDSERRTIELGEIAYRADRYQIHTTLQRRGQRQENQQ